MGGLCISSCWNSRRRRSAVLPLLLLGAALQRVMHYREGNARGQGLSRVNMRAVVKWKNHVFRGSSQLCSHKHVVLEETREDTKDKQIYSSVNLFDLHITRCLE